MIKKIVINNVPSVYTNWDTFLCGILKIDHASESQNQFPTLSFNRFLSLHNLSNFSRLSSLKLCISQGLNQETEAHTQRVKLK